MILYLLTISCQQKTEFILKEDLDEVLIYLKLNEDSIHIYKSSYERSGKYHQLHFHGIIEVKSAFRWKPYIQYGDLDHMNLTFRIHWKRINNYLGAVEYVYKDTHNSPIKQLQIFQENIYKYHRFDTSSQHFIPLSGSA